MKKKIVAVIGLSLLLTKWAWAGAAAPAPELPMDFAPFILLGLGGVVLWVRHLMKK